MSEALLSDPIESVFHKGAFVGEGTRSPPDPGDLTDEPCSPLKPQLPRAAVNRRMRLADLREVVNPLFAPKLAGWPWRSSPRDFALV